MYGRSAFKLQNLDWYSDHNIDRSGPGGMSSGIEYGPNARDVKVSDPSGAQVYVNQPMRLQNLD